MTEQQELAAGDFSSWLRQARSALLTECGTAVDCGECIACCNSSYFIHIRPEETPTLGRIRKDLLVQAPGLPRGNVLLGYDKNGLCPMLVDAKCTIYEHRPLTCRAYDCRVFTAAGMSAGGDDKARINQRVKRWRFSFPARIDRDEHRAVQAAAKFILKHAACFPGGKIPKDPSQLAVLAIKACEVFLGKDRGSNAETAHAIVEACRTFDTEISRSLKVPR